MALQPSGVKSMNIASHGGSAVAKPDSCNISVAKSGGMVTNTASMMNTMGGELSKSHKQHTNRNKKK